LNDIQIIPESIISDVAELVVVREETGNRKQVLVTRPELR
jgi:hypothetical protein